MDIQLKSLKNISSVNVDSINKIEILNKVSEMTEYDVKNYVNSSEVFDAEREANEIYRIYGKVEYLSLLNGLTNTYKTFGDFFSPQTTSKRDIYTNFKFNIVRPKTLKLIAGTTNQYVRYFEIVATPNDFELFNVGFANNVYGEQSYGFCFNKDFDVSNYFDSEGFPITELFLYPEYILGSNGYSEPETISRFEWNSTNTPIRNNTLTTSDGIYGDVIQHDKYNFNQTVLSAQTYQIGTMIHVDPIISNHIYWKYNPFIPLRLRYFSNDLSRGNSDSTSYEIVQSIPPYATNVGGYNFVWRDILPQGYFDPISGLGVDYPFINKTRYLFSNIILDIIPDLSDNYTKELFDAMQYKTPIKLNEKPTSNLNEIGKPC